MTQLNKVRKELSILMSGADKEYRNADLMIEFLMRKEELIMEQDSKFI